MFLFVQPRGCKGKGRDRGYKVTNMASHAASLVYTPGYTMRVTVTVSQRAAGSESGFKS